MTNQNFKIIHASEQEDFRRAVSRFGLDPHDFKLEESSDKGQPLAEGLFAIIGTVTVEYRPSHRTRTYTAGHGTAWTVAFESDLRAGKFE